MQPLGDWSPYGYNKSLPTPLTRVALVARGAPTDIINLYPPHPALSPWLRPYPSGRGDSAGRVGSEGRPGIKITYPHRRLTEQLWPSKGGPIFLYFTIFYYILLYFTIYYYILLYFNIFLYFTIITIFYYNKIQQSAPRPLRDQAPSPDLAAPRCMVAKVRLLCLPFLVECSVLMRTNYKRRY